MNRHEVKNQLPGNRPYGMPGNARFAGGGVAIGIMFIVINLAGNYSVYTNVPGNYFGVIDIVLFPLGVLCGLLALLLNTGKLIIIKLYRKLAMLVSVGYVGAILLNVAQIVYYKWDRPVMAAIGTIILLLVSPVLFLMWRDFRRSRWLDPQSLPSEWELAAIRDPSSINYRPPKVKKGK
ncbi:MAG: hypothetical protein KGK02_06315 [Rhodospirillales bacterium]|nr:hypothetical protein [Rhodospirillales bacterium]